MTTVQNLTIIQRENLLKMIFNLTYGLDDDEMEALNGKQNKWLRGQFATYWIP